MDNNKYTYIGSELREQGYTSKRDFTKKSNTTHYYEVTKPNNAPWPTNTALINFCDDGPGNFGGSVNINGNIAYVKVYVD